MGAGAEQRKVAWQEEEQQQQQQQVLTLNGGPANYRR